MGGAFPDGVPRIVLAAALCRRAQDAIEDCSTMCHPEAHPTQVIMEGVQINIELVCLHIVVSAGEGCLDSCRLSVEEPCPEVDGIITHENPHLGPLGGWLALGRIGLGEAASWLGLRPIGFVELAIYGDRPRQSCSPDLRRSLPCWRGGLG